MSHLLQSHPAVVAGLLARYALTSAEAVGYAVSQLQDALGLSMQHTACYSKISQDQALPDGIEPTSHNLASYVHPENIAAAYHSLSHALAATTGAALSPAAVQVFSGGAWHPLSGTTTQPVPVDLRIPPPAPAPVAPPPAPAPIAPPPAPAPAPAAPAADTGLAALLNEALGPQAAAVAPIIAPTTVPAATPTVTTPAAPAAAPVAAQFPNGVNTAEDLAAYRTATGHPSAVLGAPVPVTAQGVPGPAHVTLEQARAEQHLAPVEGLPTADVMADRTSAAGRPAKSPFERPVEPRKQVGKPPFWWSHLLVSAPKLFTDNPANALDPSSTGSGPVQSYAILVQLVDKVLRNADPALTVAELRQFLREVDANMSALPSRDGVYQIADEIFAPGKE